MKIKCYRRQNHIYVRGYVLCPNHLPAGKYVKFLVDTGCTKSTILDPQRLGINCNILPLSGQAQTAGGLVNTHSLQDVVAVFRLDNGDHYWASIPEMLVTPIGLDGVVPYLLLGMDVIGRFKRFVAERRVPYFEI